ncbi:rRNA maturation RNAse YbeY [Candidatus Haliotispira prima]|uniref:Endoribonuclease YbeY n=1 Tax=Candidatus Haliotispira prima TaxID=3034016 RepID=A0ABY8MHH6_9SPIO|nr:rRNA maturation RNAse YbeY [Candidatus Haliotispira prima]
MTELLCEPVVQIDGPGSAELEQCLEQIAAGRKLSPAGFVSGCRDFLRRLLEELADDTALQSLLEQEGRDKQYFRKNWQVSLLLCSEGRIAWWNSRFRGEGTSTDILSFPIQGPSQKVDSRPVPGFFRNSRLFRNGFFSNGFFCDLGDNFGDNGKIKPGHKKSWVWRGIRFFAGAFRRESPEKLHCPEGMETGEPQGGDLILSLSNWLDNCREFCCEPEEELQRLLIHGLLHLTGLDHSAEESPSEPKSPMLQYQEILLTQSLQRRAILPQ